MANIKWERLIHKEYIKKHNMPRDYPYHALMTYALAINTALEANEGRTESQALQQINPKNIIQVQAFIYQVSVEAMVRCWPEIDRIMEAEALAPIPYNSYYRHNVSSSIIMPKNNGLII